MGLFDGILGGVQGIVAQMESQGLGATVQSWVGTGANQPLTPAGTV